MKIGYMNYCRYAHHFFLFLAGIYLAGFLPFSARAQHIDINAQIELLKKQVTLLQEQLDALEQKQNTAVFGQGFEGVHAFQTYLEREMSGNEVKNLQLFL